MKNYAIGADVGGSHITIAIVNLVTSNIIKESIVRKKVNAKGHANSIFSKWERAINKSIKHAGRSPEKVKKENIRGIGIAMPGPFDYENGICLINDPQQGKFLALYQMNVGDAIAKRTGFDRNAIRFKNDAECFLLGEVFGGNIPRDNRFVGITLGTGFGSAYLIEGIASDGNLWCASFKNGIAEDFVSTRWFKKRYNELTGKKIKGAKCLAQKIVANKKEAPMAQQLFDEFGTTLGEFLASLLQQNNIDTLIVGGNIAQSIARFRPALEKELAKNTPTVAIIAARLGENATLMGAASLLSGKQQ